MLLRVNLPNTMRPPLTIRDILSNTAACLTLSVLLALGALLCSCNVSVAPDGTRTYAADQQTITTVAGIAAWEYARKHGIPAEAMPDTIPLPPQPAIVVHPEK